MTKACAPLQRRSPATVTLCASLLVVLLCLSNLPATVSGFYIPGATPTFYEAGADVKFWVNSLRSNAVMFPREYYRMPFCRPESVEKKTPSLGELIWGDRQLSSLYTVHMAKNSSCMLVPHCNVTENNVLVRSKLKELTRAIEKGYRGFMNIDNLPAFNDGTQPLGGTCADRMPKDQQFYSQRGYALGVPKVCSAGRDRTLINNHLHFKIYYNRQPDVLAEKKDGRKIVKYMVVGLNAIPYSVRHDGESTCNDEFTLSALSLEGISTKDLEVKPDLKLYWSYSVEWHESDQLWATRWDSYFRSSNINSKMGVHYLYIGFSLLIVAVVACVVASILMRALRKDFVRYNMLDASELQEETGWKLVHADVFRSPDRAGLLSIVFGNGVQVLGVVGGAVLLSLLGMLSPSRRGSLLVAVIMLIMFTAIIEGYACAFLQRYLNCKSWRDVIASGCALQGLLCGVYMLTVIIGKAHDSTTAVPFSVILTIYTGWVMVSLPLTILGASFAFREDPLQNPVRVGRLAREIPVQPSMNRPAFLFLVPPLFPLVTVVMEVQFVMQALWAGQVYYVFGVFAIAGFLWAVVAALVTISQLYYVLCYENHRWWWIAFLCPGCLGLHMFVYSIIFYMSQLAISGFASSLLYFLYMGLISLAYGLAAGAIGLGASIIFIRYIYASIKVD